MTPRRHSFAAEIEWTGNDGRGTASYGSYRRDHEVTRGSHPPIAASADPAFRGDPDRWNPEQLLVASLAQCHMLWFLHLCADAGVVVETYRDEAVGDLEVDPDGSGRMVGVRLRPHVRVADSASVDAVDGLHQEAQARCFIARSVTFPVEHHPTTVAG